MRRFDWRRPDVLLALILILAGLLWLLNSLGVPVCSILWPLILIGLGVWILLSRYRAPETPGVRRFAQALGSARRVTLDLPGGAGDLRLEALAGEGQLAEARFELATAATYEEAGAEGRLRFSRVAAVWWFPFVAWIAGRRQIGVSRAVRWRVRARWMVGDSRIDASGLSLESLEVTNLLGDLRVVFPAQGEVTATIDSTLGDLRLEIPVGMAARIRSLGGNLGDWRVDQRFERRAGEYASPGFDTAPNRLDLQIGTHLGDVRIR